MQILFGLPLIETFGPHCLFHFGHQRLFDLLGEKVYVGTFKVEPAGVGLLSEESS